MNVLVYWLTNLVNVGETENSDTMIAKALMSIRHEIGSWSMDRIAQEFYVSQAGISRFIRKAGYRNFSEFKSALQESVYIVEKSNPAIGKNYTDALDSVYTRLKPVPEGLKELDRDDVENTLGLFEKYENIYFFGSELSMSIIRLLQVKLVSQGKNVYAIHNMDYQAEIIGKLTENDLAISISMGGRWFELIKTKLKKDYVKAGSLILWTVSDDHSDRDVFDRVLMMGHADDPNLGYHYLMQLVMLLYEMM